MPELDHQQATNQQEGSRVALSHEDYLKIFLISYFGGLALKQTILTVYVIIFPNELGVGFLFDLIVGLLFTIYWSFWPALLISIIIIYLYANTRLGRQSIMPITVAVLYYFLLLGSFLMNFYFIFEAGRLTLAEAFQDCCRLANLADVLLTSGSMSSVLCLSSLLYRRSRARQLPNGG